MNIKDFKDLIDSRTAAIKYNLGVKGEEYNDGIDILHNFKRGSQIAGCCREKVLFGFMLKHIISVLDMIDEVENSNKILDDDRDKQPRLARDIDKVDEKIGDCINYLILLEASFKERINQDQENER